MLVPLLFCYFVKMWARKGPGDTEIHEHVLAYQRIRVLPQDHSCGEKAAPCGSRAVRTKTAITAAHVSRQRLIVDGRREIALRSLLNHRSLFSDVFSDVFDDRRKDRRKKHHYDLFSDHWKRRRKRRIMIENVGENAVKGPTNRRINLRSHNDRSLKLRRSLRSYKMS